MAGLTDVIELVRGPAALSVPGDPISGGAWSGSSAGRSAGLAASSILLYWAGMAANDWADRQLDARERPERPIPSGRITPRAAFAAAAGLTGAGLAVAAMAGGRRALRTAAPLAGAIWAYDLAAKGTAAGPAVMAACRGLDVLLGASNGRQCQALVPALTVAAHTYTVTALSRAEVDGASRPLPALTLAATAAIAALSAAPPRAGNAKADSARADSAQADSARADSAKRRNQLVSCALAGYYLVSYGRAQARAITSPDPGTIRAAVGAGITGLPALQGALVARSGAPATGVAVALAAPAGRRLARRWSPT